MIIAPGAILFNRTVEQCRSIGRRGGRARARNLRVARPLATVPRPVDLEVQRETAHEAYLLLDDRFPHLRSGQPALMPAIEHRVKATQRK